MKSLSEVEQLVVIGVIAVVGYVIYRGITGLTAWIPSLPNFSLPSLYDLGLGYPVNTPSSTETGFPGGGSGDGGLMGHGFGGGGGDAG
jgi:hypothetical protein